eukprot:m.441540 g.441540  ORF g.441540 m.441540 type:complete len:119 (-) comp18672_c0_seq1:204-560(-)
MAKSLRSKIKRKFRAVKREKYHSRVIDALKKNGTAEDPALKKAYAKAFLDRKSGPEDMDMEGEAVEAAEAAVLADAVPDVDPDEEEWAERVLRKKKNKRLNKRKTAQVRRQKQKVWGE